MTPKPMTAEELGHSSFRKLMKFLLLYGIGLPFVFASWFYVLYVIAVVIYRKSKDAGVPQTVREFRWKLRNTDMSFDQLVRGLITVGGLGSGELSSGEFDRIKEEVITDMIERGLTPGH